jgi:hypothetical protein
MPFRTFRVEFANMTSHTLTLDHTHLDHGIFTPALSPPNAIGSGAVGVWRGESDGFLTGTTGLVRYKVPDSGTTVTIGWAVPAVGNNDTDLEINDPAGNIVFFPRAFGATFDRPPGVYAFPTAGKSSTTGVVIPFFPGGQNPFPDSTLPVGIRDRREPVRLSTWMKFLGRDPNAGVAVIGTEVEEPNFSVRTLLGPPADWNLPLFP